MAPPPLRAPESPVGGWSIRIVVTTGGGEEEFLLTVPSASTGTVGDLIAQLPGPAAAIGLLVDDRLVSSDCPLARAGLCEGAQIEVIDARPAREQRPVARLWHAWGLDAGHFDDLVPGRLMAGRRAGAEVVVSSPTVSLDHLRLDVGTDGTTQVVDLGSVNGTRVGPSWVSEPTGVAANSQITAGAVAFRLTPPPAVAVPSSGPPVAWNRPPHPPAAPAPRPLPVPAAPPGPPGAPPFGWATALAPLGIGLVLGIVFGPIMALFAVFGPVVAVATWAEGRRRTRRETSTVRAEYQRAVATFREEIDARRDQERLRLGATLADPAACVEWALTADPALWQRRSEHGAALQVALGRGPVAVVDLDGPPPTELESQWPELATVDDLPVAADLAGGGIGLVGPDDATRAVARSLVIQLAVHRGPADLAFRGPPTGPWEWLQWLPHRTGRAPDTNAPETVEIIDGGAPIQARAETRTIALAREVGSLPAWCTTVVHLDGVGGGWVVRHDQTGPPVQILAGGVSPATAARTARSLARWSDPETNHAGLARRVDLFDLIGAPNAERLTRAWRENRPPTAVLGTSENGVLAIDLDADGPHLLVAGTTGAGKSELLRTLIASLATQLGPERLALVLVDYKGGSAFDRCAGLPQCAAVVTDLDQRLGERALICLQAELRRRETALREAGAETLAAYQAQAPVGDPLPRLVVIVDEFAALAAELGDFVDSLVNVAQRGRSLGVHLILATQRPAGAVNDHIRANTNTRIALRVVDGSDSIDVIGTADAAKIDPGRPGRAFARCGPASPTQFQAALVTGPYVPADELSVRPLLAEDQPDAAHAETGLDRLVAATASAADRAGLGRPEPPWPPALPDRLMLTDLPSAGPTDGAAIGLVDEPDRQRQSPFCWNPSSGSLLVFGAPGSGTTTVLATVALALSDPDRQPNTHLYVLDAGRDLAALDGLPTVGSVIAIGDRQRQLRLLRRLADDLDFRREARPGETDPTVVVLIDGLGPLRAELDDPDGRRAFDSLGRLITEGPTVGLSVALTADRPATCPGSWLAATDQKLALRLADRFDYLAVGPAPDQPETLPPGRGVTAAGTEVQIAVPPGDLETEVARLAGDSPPGRGPDPIGILPAVVDGAGVCAHTEVNREMWKLPIGIGDDDLGVAHLVLHPGAHGLIAGPARSGRTTALRTLARSVMEGADEIDVIAVGHPNSPLRSVNALVVEPGALAAEVTGRSSRREALILIDDADEIEAVADLEIIIGRSDIHIVAAGRSEVLRGIGHWCRCLRARSGVILGPDPELDGELLGVSLPRTGASRDHVGRGYLVADGRAELVQVAR